MTKLDEPPRADHRIWSRSETIRPLFDPAYYVAQKPKPNLAGLSPIEHFLRIGAAQNRNPHPLFDCAFYLRANPGVGESGINPVVHYLETGARDGRSPHPLFDAKFYLAVNRDVRAAGINPLIHYLLSGASEGRDPHPLFETAYYLDGYSQLDPRQVNPLVDYVLTAGINRRDPNPLFDSTFYRQQVPELSNSPIPPLQHFIQTGETAGINPHPLFDCAFYLRTNPDVAASGINSLAHYLEHGAKDGRSPHPLFDAEFYFAVNLDVRDGANPVIHYLSSGAGEGRNPHPLFDTTYYVDASSQLDPERVNPLVDYVLTAGINRGDPHPLFDTAFYRQHTPEPNSSLIPPLQHFLQTGEAAGINPHPLFDLAYFKKQTSTAPIPTTTNALVQYVYCNGRDGRDPHPLFSTSYYLANNPDVDRVGDLPLRHYLMVGGLEKRRPHPLFDSGYYLEHCAEARGQRVNPLVHYVVRGASQCAPHPAFDPQFYLAANRDDCSAGTNPLVHFVTTGLVQGRAPCAAVTSAELRRLTARCAGNIEELSAALEAAVAQSRSRREPERHSRDYAAYQKQRMRMRQPGSSSVTNADLLTLITPAWNTPIEFLTDLVEGVLDQTDPNFRWFILDNGSDDRRVVSLLETLRDDTRVDVSRVETNLGIIGGMRYCLEHARGTYVVPLDHDDLVTPDCIGLVRAALEHHGYPDLLYTDEDLSSGGAGFLPYFKPDWDPVLFMNSCFTAHLTAMRRDRALELGCYTDPKAEASPDWDSFTRFAAAGAKPAHLPEVVYSWRVHPRSTADNMATKPYVYDSHRAVLRRLVDAIAPGRFAIEPSPLFNNTPDWRIRGIDLPARPIASAVAGDRSGSAHVQLVASPGHEIHHLSDRKPLAELREIAAAMAARGALIHLCGDVKLEGSDWIGEVRTQWNLFPDLAILGGPLFDGDRIVAAAGVFGYGRGCDSPDIGRVRGDPGFFAQMWKQRSVSAVPAQNMVVDAAFLMQALERHDGRSVSLGYLGAWLGAEAARLGRRVVYTPFLCASVTWLWDDQVDDSERAAFVVANRDLLPDTRYYSPRLGLDPATAYQPVEEAERVASLARLFCWARGLLDETAALAAGEADRLLSARSITSRAPGPRDDTAVPSFSLMTPVYEKTSAALLGETAAAVRAQTLPPLEWILLAQGPVPDDLRTLLHELGRTGLARVFSLPDNRGIIGGLRWCLEQAAGDYVVVLDADDLLASEAIAVLSEAALKADRPDALFSDEAMIVAGVVTNPWLRPGWDPVLNLANSYVWHALALRRDRALALGCYSDPGTEYCQDWDTAMRLWQSGGRLHHVPRILYHWRQHAASSTNSGGAVAEVSLASCRHLLARVAAERGKSDLFAVADYPVSRGQRELYLQRRRLAPPAVDAMLLHIDPGVAPILDEEWLRNAALYPFGRVAPVAAASCQDPVDGLQNALAECEAPYVALLDAAALPAGDLWPWEAISHFDWHDDVVAVSGRLLTPDGTVVAGGEMLDSGGRVEAPFFGLDRRAPGPMALALKPQTIDLVNPAIAVCRAGWLRDALAALPSEMPLVEVPYHLALAARQAGRRIVYSPLLETMLATGAVLTQTLAGQALGPAPRVLASVRSQPERRGALGYAELSVGAIAREIADNPVPLP